MPSRDDYNDKLDLRTNPFPNRESDGGLAPTKKGHLSISNLKGFAPMGENIALMGMKRILSN